MKTQKLLKCRRKDMQSSDPWMVKDILTLKVNTTKESTEACTDGLTI